jgi:hypothetical protein
MPGRASRRCLPVPQLVGSATLTAQSLPTYSDVVRARNNDQVSG